jgi:hypothetical protein
MNNIDKAYTDLLQDILDNGCHIWDGDAYKNYCKNVDRETVNQGDTFLDTKRNITSVCKRKEIGTSKKIPIIICEYEGCYIEEDCKKILTQEEFINKCKTDPEFSEKWGLKIGERELNDDELNIFNLLKQTFTKLITITYNDKTIECYE